MSGSTADCPSPAPAVNPWLRLILRVCRYALAAFFLAAAVSKITDLAGFRDFLAVHAGLSPWSAFAVASVLPWLELTCGLCLLSGWAAREAAVLTLLLLAAFVAHNLAHPVEADCGCAVWPSRLSLPPGGPWVLGRNLALMAFALLTALRAR